MNEAFELAANHDTISADIFARMCSSNPKFIDDFEGLLFHFQDYEDELAQIDMERIDMACRPGLKRFKRVLCSGPLISDLDISPELNKRYGAYKFRANFRHLLEEIKELQGEACDKAQTQLIENYKFLGWVVFKHFERANLALVSTIEERLYIDLNKLLKETSDKFNVSHSYGQ